MKFKSSLMVLLMCLQFSVCKSEEVNESEYDVNHLKAERLINNVFAFAKLYGYVRYFHPSNEALALDWEKFAIYGVERVKGAQNTEALKNELNALFQPITTFLTISEESKDYPLPKLEPAKGRTLRAWQHHGLGAEQGNSRYISNYTSRFTTDFPGYFDYEIKLDDLLGSFVKLSAKVKANSEVSEFGTRLNLYTHSQNAYSENKIIAVDEWQTFEAVLKIEKPSDHVHLGGSLMSSGQVWFHDLKLFVSKDNENWVPIPLPALSTNADENNNSNNWLFYSQKLFSFQVIENADSNVLTIKSEPWYVFGSIFKELPQPNEIIQKAIGASLKIQMPITVWDESRDLTENQAFQHLFSAVEKIDTTSASAHDENMRLANIIIAWNALQHFYPYFDTIDTDWSQELSVSLVDVLDDNSDLDFYNSLRKMIGKIHDGHGFVDYKNLPPEGGLPIKAGWVENKVVIVASDSEQFQVGDIIESVDGINAEEYLIESESYVSGSPHLKRFRTLNQFGIGELGTTVELVVNRAGQSYVFEFVREKLKSSLFHSELSIYDFSSIKEVEKGIYYINLFLATIDEFNTKLPQLAKAKGIVFDFRKDGKVVENSLVHYLTSDVLSHLIKAPQPSVTWRIPKVIYPDQENLSFRESSWDITPKEPYFEGEKVFLIIPPVVSYGETILSFVDYYELAKTVGEPTAGTNGNVNYIPLIGGHRIKFTGMKVLKHDGSQLHLLGYEPDYPVYITIESVREGLDLFLEKALEVIKMD